MYLFDRKRLAEFLRSELPDRFLHMEIMLGHVDIRMAHNALNRGQIHSQRLHLADVCVSAGMRRQHPNVGNAIQIRLEGIAKIRWVAGLPHLPYLPDKPAGGIPEIHSTVPDVFRNRHIPDAVSGLGHSDMGRALNQIHRLTDVDVGAVRRDVPGFQRKDLLHPHPGCQHQSDAPAHSVIVSRIFKE